MPLLTLARHFLIVSAPVIAMLACGTPASPQSPAAPSPQSAQFTGLVGTVSGACPSISFTAGNRTVTTTPATSFQAIACTAVARGTVADVDARRDAGGAWVATRVALAPDAPGAVGLLSDVAAGGYVLFLRHSERDASALTTPALAEIDNRGECVPGSQLTAAGRADATALGERFRRYGIEVDKVFASPTCRTREMATLAFGAFEATRALTWAGMWAPGEDETLALQLRARLATVPRAGTVTVLIAHNDVLRSSRVGQDITLDQAEAAVFRPRGGDAFEFLGKIPKAEWKGK